MSLFEIILLAIGLSMDSLAVSVTSGTLIPRCTAGNMLKIGSIFALFQAGMTAGGYLCGMGFRRLIESFDHWIAFILLLYLGGNMIRESFRPEEEKEEKRTNPLATKTLCGLGIATSIDALAVGISLAILKTPLLPLVLLVGAITFLFSASGIYVGHQVGRKINLRLDLIGGVILIAIGLRILIEHLFFS